MELNREHWTQEDYAQFRAYLQSINDDAYKEFNNRIIPDTPHAYGIRIPAVRKIAKEILKGNYREFIALPKTDYHEEVIIEGLVRAGDKCGYDQILKHMKEFSGKIYNWAICDTVSFKGLKPHTDLFISDAEKFVHSNNPWAARMGFNALMSFCLTDEYIDRVFEYVNSVNSDFYYVQMVQAWLIATAAAKQRDKTMAFLENNSLDSVTFCMAVRKIRDSYRISKEDKELVNLIKIKNNY